MDTRGTRVVGGVRISKGFCYAMLILMMMASADASMKLVRELELYPFPGDGFMDEDRGSFDGSDWLCSWTSRRYKLAGRGEFMGVW